MKKILFAASFMMFSIGAYAQHEAGFLTFQPKAGFNVARYTDADGTSPRFGVAAGVELEYQIKKKFSVATGLLYSMQGVKADVRTDYYSTSRVTFKTDYINIPIIANIYLLKGLAIKFGIQPGFNINAKYTFSAGVGSENYSLSRIGVKVNTFDLAIPVGLSYENKYIVFDARYNIGVSKLLETPADDSRNCVFQFTIGHKFRL